MIRFSQAILATGVTECLASLFIHRFIYSDERTWWTQHRLGPAIGTAIAMFGAAFSRHCLRDAVDGADAARQKRHLSVAMDWLAVLGAAAAGAIGIVLADMMREWFSEGDRRNAGTNQPPPGVIRGDEWIPAP